MSDLQSHLKLQEFIEQEGRRVGLQAFINRLRIMKSIDRHELTDAGIIGRSDIELWAFFRNDPFKWLMVADDEKAEKLWNLIERRTRK